MEKVISIDVLDGIAAKVAAPKLKTKVSLNAKGAKLTMMLLPLETKSSKATNEVWESLSCNRCSY